MMRLSLHLLLSITLLNAINYFDVPLNYQKKSCKEEDIFKVKIILEKIFNISIYMTFNFREIKKLKNFLMALWPIIKY